MFIENYNLEDFMYLYIHPWRFIRKYFDTKMWQGYEFLYLQQT